MDIPINNFSPPIGRGQDPQPPVGRLTIAPAMAPQLSPPAEPVSAYSSGQGQRSINTQNSERRIAMPSDITSPQLTPTEEQQKALPVRRGGSRGLKIVENSEKCVSEQPATATHQPLASVVEHIYPPVGRGRGRGRGSISCQGSESCHVVKPENSFVSTPPAPSVSQGDSSPAIGREQNPQAPVGKITIAPAEPVSAYSSGQGQKSINTQDSGRRIAIPSDITSPQLTPTEEQQTALPVRRGRGRGLKIVENSEKCVSEQPVTATHQSVPSVGQHIYPPVGRGRGRGRGAKSGQGSESCHVVKPGNSFVGTPPTPSVSQGDERSATPIALSSNDILPETELSQERIRKRRPDRALYKPGMKPSRFETLKSETLPAKPTLLKNINSENMHQFDHTDACITFFLQLKDDLEKEQRTMSQAERDYFLRYWKKLAKIGVYQRLTWSSLPLIFHALTVTANLFEVVKEGNDEAINITELQDKMINELCSAVTKNAPAPSQDEWHLLSDCNKGFINLNNSEEENKNYAGIAIVLSCITKNVCTRKKLSEDAISAVDSLLPLIISDTKRFNDTSLCKILNALSKLICNDLPVTEKVKITIQRLLKTITNRKDALSAEHISNNILSIGRLLSEEKVWVMHGPIEDDPMAQKVKKAVSFLSDQVQDVDFETHQCVNILEGLAMCSDRALCLPTEVISPVCNLLDTLIEKKEELNHHQLQKILYATATLGDGIPEQARRLDKFIDKRVFQELLSNDAAHCLSTAVRAVNVACAQNYLQKDGLRLTSLEEALNKLVKKLESMPDKNDYDKITLQNALWIMDGTDESTVGLSQSVAKEIYSRESRESKVQEFISKSVLKVQDESKCGQITKEFSLNCLPPVDLAIPKYQLAVEIQGPYHYVDEFQTRNGSTLVKIANYKRQGYHIIEALVCNFSGMDKKSKDNLKKLNDTIGDWVEQKRNVEGAPSSD